MLEWVHVLVRSDPSTTLGTSLADRPTDGPACKRRPRNRANAKVFEHRHHLAFFFPIDSIVVVLHRDERGQVMFNGIAWKDNNKLFIAFEEMRRVLCISWTT